MTVKYYTVKTWGDKGELKDQYDVGLESEAAMRHLKKFLKSKYPHVSITPAPASRKKSRGA